MVAGDRPGTRPQTTSAGIPTHATMLAEPGLRRCCTSVRTFPGSLPRENTAVSRPRVPARAPVVAAGATDRRANRGGPIDGAPRFAVSVA